ncbi:MAG: formylmethanofuran--tetrahydromethanopterin N-formyltransferase [Sterolibacteriaceae bacterium]|jgi:formylmethanofuran--tetrahydromethanopterin N-formyltransferase|nr:formylmethanofuran--tetrahydromethanopterin N-formyltransferase [Sterolibacteriaceae bacterium]MBK9083839.1 formylmethanofuran--tetrahydromethanopterin N-formyltransferase [Sterolibacteriaceae bacterium]
MQINGVSIDDTYAEAFAMWGARVLITAENEKWALAAARAITGFATSVIGCKCEAGIERVIDPAHTPDGRPGIAVLLFAMDAEGLGKRLVERVGQCVMTCPTTACFNALEAEKTVVVGGALRYFGDGFQAAKLLDGRRFWRVPVMDGEFVVEERFGVKASVGGGNLLILGEDTAPALAAAEAAVDAMRAVPGVILPFPDGVVRSGSKVGSRYKSVMASTNDAYCPTLRAVTKATRLGAEVGCVLEIVIDGLDLAAVEEAMRRGLRAAAQPGICQISAGNYGGNLGQYKIDLRSLLGPT